MAKKSLSARARAISAGCVKGSFMLNALHTRVREKDGCASFARRSQCAGLKSCLQKRIKPRRGKSPVPAMTALDVQERKVAKRLPGGRKCKSRKVVLLRPTRQGRGPPGVVSLYPLIFAE